MQDFAEHSADLVNTLTGKTVPKQPLRWFWEGFNSVSQRLVDSQARANIRMWAQVLSPLETFLPPSRPKKMNKEECLCFAPFSPFYLPFASSYFFIGWGGQKYFSKIFLKIHRLPKIESYVCLCLQGTPMLLKLKDWPPDGDIADFLPKRYNDLINNFPIQGHIFS